MNQLNNIITQNIKELEQLLETGLVKPDDYLTDLNTLRRIDNNVSQGNIKQCRLLSKQLKGLSTDTLKQIDEYIEQLINQNIPSKIDKNDSDQQQDSNPTQGQTKSNETQAGNNEEENQQPPAPNQPTPHVNQNQFELGIALGILQKETNSLKEYLDNILARQRDTDASINNQIEQYRNIQINMGILSETIKNIEPMLIKITPEIQEATKNIKEQLVQAISDSDLFKKLPEYKTEIDSMLKKIRDTTNTDIDDLYKVVRKSAGTIVDETLEKSQKTIVDSAVKAAVQSVDSAVKAVETAREATDKKYTNLMIFGLLGFFICSGLTSAFTAKLVANYSSNNTIEYITKLLNAAADKNKEQQQVKKSKR